MKKYRLYALLLIPVLTSGRIGTWQATTDDYLKEVKYELGRVWPENRRINLVFHGHSVPAGYWNDHRVETLESYPNLVLQKLKARYPYAVINVIVTAIGGENSVKGAARFEQEILPHRPDVLFIDYALNDRGAGLEKSREAWGSMIVKAKAAGVKIILLTPSPDQRVDLTDENNLLNQHRLQVRALARQHQVGLVDSYDLFVRKIAEEGSVKPYMSWVNHPNKAGHELIAEAIIQFF